MKAQRYDVSDKQGLYRCVFLLFVSILALSVTASPCHLPQRGRQGRSGRFLALPLGELARQRLRGQARQNKTQKHSDTMSLTNRDCIAVFFAFCQHPCPLRHCSAMPPPLVGEALASRDVFRQTQVGFIENETSLPRALLPGELSSGCETERLDKGRLSRERR